uniref:Protein translocase subunit SecA n=1 Tax=Talaromyces marneffei PM1 TaxID=1077442 RepID=A0A093USP7_TALMA
MHKYVLERYRKKSAAFTADEQKFEQARRPSAKHQQRLNAASLERQKNLQKSARNFLSLIRRGNQGYQQPLDRILMLAYGRIGAKKYTLLSKLVPNGRGGNKVFNSSADIEEYLEQKKKEPAGAYWEVPEVLQALIKSQRNDSFARSAHGKRFRASDTVNIPKLNAWMKPLPECRQENLRKRLLNRSKYAALPPADPAEANLLRGLIDGTEPWKPPVRRTKVLLPEQGINLRGQTKFDFPTTFKARTYVLTMEKGEFQALFGNKDRDHDCNAASTAASGQKRELNELGH